MSDTPKPATGSRLSRSSVAATPATPAPLGYGDDEYKPLMTGPLCSVCHTPLDQISKEDVEEAE